MDQNAFITFKTNLERLSTVELMKKGPSQLTTCQKSDIFWIILERKIRNTFWYNSFWHRGRSNIDRLSDEQTPALKKLLELETPKSPPFQVLRTFIEICRSIDDYKNLVDAYPDCVHVKMNNGDLLLHRAIKYGGYQSRDILNSIICKSIVHSLDADFEHNKFGGLSTKNNAGRSPLMMIFGLIVVQATRNPNCDRWIWFKSLIQRVVHIQLHYNKNHVNGFDEFDQSIFENRLRCFSKELDQTPLLHAVLQLDCPLGLLNRIIDSSDVGEFCRCDSFGRTPLTIALNNKATPAEIVIKLFQKTPVKVLQLLNMEKEGDLPLHRILKAGIKYQSKSENDLSLVATVAGTAPRALFTCDEIYQMPPFLLACIDGQWSLDVVYGLLRAGPFAMEPYITISK